MPQDPAADDGLRATLLSETDPIEPDAPAAGRGFWAVARTPRMLTFLAVLVAAAIACGLLGSWQLDRAELRGAQAAQEARDEILLAPPVPIGELIAPHQTFGGELVGRRVTAVGTFTGEQLLVEGRAHRGEVGYLVLAELRVVNASPAASLDASADAAPGASPDSVSDTAPALEGAPVLAVVRGWQPDASAAPAPPEGEVSVTGHLQSGEAAGPGLASDGARLPDGQTDSISMAQLAGRWGTPIYTGYVVQSDPSPPAPLVQLDPPALPGSGFAWRNLMYAIQWWIFGGFALAIWIRSVRDEAREPAADLL